MRIFFLYFFISLFLCFFIVCTYKKIEMPDILYEEVIEVKERVVLTQENCKISYPHHGNVSGKSDVTVRIVF